MPPGRPETTENAKNTGPDPSRWALPQPPPPRLLARSSLPERVGFDNMIPAPVRSVPKTNRRCLRLRTSMQRDCDTVNPLHPGASPCGYLPVAQPGSQLCDTDPENHRALENRDTSHMLQNPRSYQTPPTTLIAIPPAGHISVPCQHLCSQ